MPLKHELTSLDNDLYSEPDERGHFGDYGGKYVAETLMPLIEDVHKAWNDVKDDTGFWIDFHNLAKDYIGRPSPLYFAQSITKHLNGAQIYFKRDELNHTGAHKINNCLI
jgi:tryptophan synthase beta chain